MAVTADGLQSVCCVFSEPKVTSFRTLDPHHPYGTIFSTSACIGTSPAEGVGTAPPLNGTEEIELVVLNKSTGQLTHLTEYKFGNSQGPGMGLAVRDSGAGAKDDVSPNFYTRFFFRPNIPISCPIAPCLVFSAGFYSPESFQILFSPSGVEV